MPNKRLLIYKIWIIFPKKIIAKFRACYSQSIGYYEPVGIILITAIIPKYLKKS